MFLISFKCGKYKGFQLMSQNMYDNYCDIIDRAKRYLDQGIGNFYLYPEDGTKPITISGSKALESCFNEEEFSIDECLATMALVDYNIQESYGFFPLYKIHEAIWDYNFEQASIPDEYEEDLLDHEIDIHHITFSVNCMNHLYNKDYYVTFTRNETEAEQIEYIDSKLDEYIQEIIDLEYRRYSVPTWLSAKNIVSSWQEVIDE
jgi:hypothetical protein